MRTEIINIQIDYRVSHIAFTGRHRHTHYAILAKHAVAQVQYYQHTHHCSGSTGSRYTQLININSAQYCIIIYVYNILFVLWVFYFKKILQRHS